MKKNDTTDSNGFSEREYKVLFESSPIAYFSISQSGIIQRVNSAAVNLLGFPVENILKRNISSLFASSDSSSDSGKLLVSEVRQGKEIKDVEVQLVNSEGENIWVSLTASMIENSPGGKLIGVMATNIDRRKRAEARASTERERTSLALEVMTHDLNNVNQSLIFSLGLLAEAEKLNVIGQNLLDQTLQEVKRSSRLISNLRTIFSLSDKSLEKEWTDLHFCLNSATEQVRNEFPKKSLVVDSNIQQGDYIAEAHSLLTVVFFNIIHNSVQFDASDEVHVSVNASISKSLDKIRVEFEDNGPGVPDNLKEFIFKRSGSPDAQVVGRGLGLTLVDRILETLGGDIWVEDRVEDENVIGARFIIEIPAWNEQKMLECGKTSCITFYKSEKCMFCEPTFEILTGLMDELGIPQVVANVINVDDPGSHIKEDDLPMLPLTRICSTEIAGFADIDDMRVALMNLLMTACYPY